LEAVLDRAWKGGMEKIMVTGGSLSECQHARDLCEHHDRKFFIIKISGLYFTVGCHPTRCNEFLSDPTSYLNQLKDMAHHPKAVAIGECGLDYDRLQFCDKEVQLR
jgi:TatD DNase family protein